MTIPLVGAGPSGGSFDPASIDDLVAWYKADVDVYQSAGGAASGNTDPVGEWQDQSGTGNHVTQATASKKPTLATNVQNGKPGILFDGTDDFLRKTGVSYSQPTTIFLVTKRDAVVGNPYRIIDGDTGARQLVDYLVTDALQMYAGNIVASDAGVLDADAAVITAQFNSASSIGRVNGAQALAADASTQALGAITLGISEDVTTAPYKGHIFEVLIYNAALTAGQISQVENYLNGRWAAF